MRIHKSGGKRPITGINKSDVHRGWPIAFDRGAAIAKTRIHTDRQRASDLPQQYKQGETR